MNRIFEIRFDDGKHDAVQILVLASEADQAIDLAIGSRAKSDWKPTRKDLVSVNLQLGGANVIVSRKSMPVREPVLVIGARAGGCRPAAKR
jgi:hypothetical protein